MEKVIYFTVECSPKGKWHLSDPESSGTVCGISFVDTVIGCDVIKIDSGMVMQQYVHNFQTKVRTETIPLASYCKNCARAVSGPIRHKMIQDPDADDQQWLYRGCIIMQQDHPSLLKYCCFDEDGNTIHASSSKSGAREIIDHYLKERESQSH